MITKEKESTEKTLLICFRNLILIYTNHFGKIWMEEL